MDTRERLVLDLPAELVAKLRERVALGDFRSESEAVETILKFHFVDDDLEAGELDDIRAAVAEGAADVDAGRVYEADAVHAELRARIKAYAARQA
jgi:Arc/MetJ-type ribon-helix-helix transcriptional regulator